MTAQRTHQRRRTLSRRRVKDLVAIGQQWTDLAGDRWTVRQIHRKDSLVELTRPGATRRFVTFAELGGDYLHEGAGG